VGGPGDDDRPDTDDEDEEEDEDENEGARGMGFRRAPLTPSAGPSGAGPSPVSDKSKPKTPAKATTPAGKYRARFGEMNPAEFRGDTVYSRVAAPTFAARGDVDVYTGVTRSAIEAARAQDADSRRGVQVDHVVELQLLRDAVVSADESYTSAVGTRAATALLPHVNNPKLNFNVTDHWVNVNLKRTANMRCLKAVARGDPRREHCDLGLVLQARADDPRLHLDARIRVFDIRPGR